MTGEREARPTDAELLRRHVQGEHEAFGVLFSRHRERLWAVAVRTLGDAEDAADALQEAMISAFRRAGSFRGDSAVTTWLHRIVVNACLDRLRRHAARPTFPAGDERSLYGLARGRASSDPTADHATALDVETALRMLPYEQRAALVLVDMLGYPVQAAADILGVSAGTIKSRCARGRARLAPHLTHLTGSRVAGQRLPGPGTPGVLPLDAQPGNRECPGGVSSAEAGASADHNAQVGRLADGAHGGSPGQPLEGGGETK